MTDRPPKIKPGEGVEVYRDRRSAWFADQKPLVREVMRERIVEKIVYRDRPEQSTLRKVGEGLEDVQAKLEARVKTDAVPVELQEHVQEGETVSEAKSRFLKLYSDLGNKVQMGIAKDFERRLHESLHAKMNWITGD